jgi:anti-sigma B factor antagonist
MSSSAFRHLGVKDVNGVTVVDLAGEPLMYASALVQEVGDELISLFKDHGCRKILLDFTHVQYVSSMMLAKLAHLEQELRHANGQLKLCGLGPVLKDTFRIGHFERVFSVYDDAESAIAQFS